MHRGQLLSGHIGTHEAWWDVCWETVVQVWYRIAEQGRLVRHVTGTNGDQRPEYGRTKMEAITELRLVMNGISG